MDDIIGMISLIIAVIIMLAVPIGMIVGYIRGNIQAVVVLGFALLTVLLGIWGAVIAVFILIISAVRRDWQTGGLAIVGVILGVVLAFIVGLLGLSGLMFLEPTAFKEVTSVII